MTVASSRRTLRVHVLGTGAMACALGARLARSGGALVTLVGTWREALHEIGRRGVTVEEAGGSWSTRLGAAPLLGPLGPADLVLVLVKSHRTEAVAGVAARCLLPRGIVVTLQNGLGNRELLEEAAPGRVAQGVTLMGATLLGPGRVRTIAGRVVLGADAGSSGPLAPLADLLRASRIQTEVTPELEPTIWRKLVANCAINPLSALTGRPNGALLESPEPLQTLTRAAEEVGVVAAAKGIELGVEAAALAMEVAQSTADNRSSMLQDLERGARTEVDALNGALVAEAQAAGVPTPVNEHLWRQVREREGRPLPASAPPPGA